MGSATTANQFALIKIFKIRVMSYDLTEDYSYTVEIM